MLIYHRRLPVMQQSAACAVTTFAGPLESRGWYATLSPGAMAVSILANCVYLVDESTTIIRMQLPSTPQERTALCQAISGGLLPAPISGISPLIDLIASFAECDGMALAFADVLLADWLV